MDTKKVWGNLRVFGAIIAFCLLATAPVAADTPPNDPLHINSAGINSGELPAPLPAMPGEMSLPAVRFPTVDMESLPVLSDERAALQTLTDNRVSVLRATINSRYASVRGSVASVRAVTDNISNAVGDPMSLSVYDGTEHVTVSGMAQRMSQSLEFGFGYARAVSALGPMGLDLVFVFVGFGWVVLVNLIVTVIRLIAALVGFMGKALDALWKLSMLLLEVMRFVVAIFDLFWPL